MRLSFRELVVVDWDKMIWRELVAFDFLKHVGKEVGAVLTDTSDAEWSDVSLILFGVLYDLLGHDELSRSKLLDDVVSGVKAGSDDCLAFFDTLTDGRVDSTVHGPPVFLNLGDLLRCHGRTAPKVLKGVGFSAKHEGEGSRLGT